MRGMIMTNGESSEIWSCENRKLTARQWGYGMKQKVESKDEVILVMHIER